MHPAALAASAGGGGGGGGEGSRSSQPPSRSDQSKPAKRKKHKNRKRRNRRQSFLVTDEPAMPRPGTSSGERAGGGAHEGQVANKASPGTYYRLGQNLSDTSLESEALLDHRYVVLYTSMGEGGFARSKVARTCVEVVLGDVS